MAIRLLTITHKLPSWIKDGYTTYAKRLTSPFNITLIEIPAEKRSVNADVKRLVDKEGEKILALIKPNHYVVALDSHGSAWTTEQFAAKLENWLAVGHTLDLIVGGPDGLADACLQRANEKWSLSPLTFPHHLDALYLPSRFFVPLVFTKNILIIVSASHCIFFYA